VVAWAGGDTGWWVVAVVLLGAGVTTAVAVRGLVVVRRARRAGYLLFRRAVLVSWIPASSLRTAAGASWLGSVTGAPFRFSDARNAGS
jgi:hypothetical protein